MEDILEYVEGIINASARDLVGNLEENKGIEDDGAQNGVRVGTMQMEKAFAILEQGQVDDNWIKQAKKVTVSRQQAI